MARRIKHWFAFRWTCLECFRSIKPYEEHGHEHDHDK